MLQTEHLVCLGRLGCSAGSWRPLSLYVVGSVPCLLLLLWIQLSAHLTLVCLMCRLEPRSCTSPHYTVSQLSPSFLCLQCNLACRAALPLRGFVHQQPPTRSQLLVHPVGRAVHV